MRTAAFALVIAAVATAVFFTGWGMSKAEVKRLNSQVTQLRSEKDQLLAEKDDLIREKAELEKKVAQLEASVKLLKDPTYEEALAFIRKDTTNETLGGNWHKSVSTVLSNAQKAGLRSYLGAAILKGKKGVNTIYAFVSFKTLDRGWVYFRADTDAEVKLELGKKYFEINSLFKSDPEFDDTIEAIYHYPPID